MSTHTTSGRYLQTDGARLHWRLEGTGPALALLHGWALDLAYWEPAMPGLLQHFTVLRFDRRGFGLSQGIPDINRNIDDLRALLDAAGIDRAVLVGMSQGARLALHFACRHPAQVRALVLDGAPALDAEPELPVAEYRRLLQSEGIGALRAQLPHHPLMRLRARDSAGGSNEAARNLLAAMIERYPGLDLLHPAVHAAAPPLQSLRVATLILNGALDSPARLEAAARLQACIGGATRVVLPQAGHLALLDDPAGYVAAVTGFCKALQT